MTMQETGKIMDILSIAYPRFYAGKSPAERKGAVALWANMFEGEPVELVAAAVKAFIACDTEGWPPTIGVVKAYILRLTQPQELTENEAWAIVSRAVKRVDWLNPTAQFDALPEEIQAVVGSPQTLVEWGKADESSFATVIASNFQRSYRAKRKSRQELAAIPASVRESIEGLLNRRLALESEKERQADSPGRATAPITSGRP